MYVMKHNPVIKSVAKNLKQIRLARHMTQSEVAKKSGITANHYAKVERGEAEPTLSTLSAIVKGLKIKSSDVLPF